jgi:hypothetical protein
MKKLIEYIAFGKPAKGISINPKRSVDGKFISKSVIPADWKGGQPIITDSFNNFYQNIYNLLKERSKSSNSMRLEAHS